MFITGALVLMLLLFATGLPIFLSFLTLNLIGLYILSGSFKGVLLVVNSMYDTGGSLSLAAIPLFILLGEILFRSSAVNVMFDAVDGLVGAVRSRLYIVSVVLSTIFGALSGSAMAVAAMMGASLLPEMEKRGYQRNLSIGTILGGSSLAPIIPPSVMAVVLGILASVSISSLLVAGIVPGILLALAFFTYVIIRVKINPKLAPPLNETSTLPWSQRSRLVLKAIPFLAIIVAILGLIISGIATPTEAAALGCVVAAVVCSLFATLRLNTLIEALRSTAWTTCMIMIIMVCSVSFSQVLNMSGVTVSLVKAVTALEWSPVVMFILLMALGFVLCMFIDQIAVMILLVPLYKPIIMALGFEPIWFWAIFLINMSIGNITPPFGYTLFALQGVARHTTIQEMYRAAIPFITLYLLMMGVLALLPGLVMWLPSKM
ncbi:TRAP transporter large permease [Paenalcaligenes niemegkensis]|uniref:TRAP transporter large permease n=1 Tax=Paenalcaligenes niemegkensis TaxID=2895469 RepID=UPI001EE90CF3|nr:TRAP transporter large permease [Paenalcaligenes niemegkensis]MCQ9618132.1 TRAP transporter large permease [Paenalcaligenes niemegkensis]